MPQIIHPVVRIGNIEVFHNPLGYDLNTDLPEGAEPLPEGWYWWSCLPGCLPDSDPIGPMTKKEAMKEARGDNW